MNDPSSNYGIEHISDTAKQTVQISAKVDSEPRRLNGSRVIDGSELKSSVQLDDEFMAFFLHELRTPLNSLAGWAHLLQQNCLNATESAKAIDSINRSTGFLKDLIEDLLDISRIANGKMQLDRSQVDFRRIVENSIDDFAPLAATKSIALTSSFDSAQSFVLGEAKRLRQIVGNLLANAIKYTPSGGYVAIELIQIRNSVQLEVKDSGVGIDSELLPFVFDRFWQGAATKRQNNGLGLGLAVAQYLVGLHDGSITAHSDGADKGATFTIRLPLAEEQNSRAAL